MKLLPDNREAISDEERTGILNDALATLFWTNPLLNKNLGEIEPPTRFKRDGLIAYADGTKWNPGSGKGLYRYDGDTSAWVKVG